MDSLPPGQNAGADSTWAPLNGEFLGSASVLPIAGAAVAFLIVPLEWRALCQRLTVIWSGAILCFLAGLRRGGSFHPDQGLPRRS